MFYKITLVCFKFRLDNDKSSPWDWQG